MNFVSFSKFKGSRSSEKRYLITIFIIIAAVIVGIVAAKFHHLNQRHDAVDQFYYYMNTFQNEEQVEVLRDTVCYEDDIIGWFFYEKDNQVYMSLEYMQRDSSNKKVFTTSDFPVPFTKETLADHDIWSRTERNGKNQIHAEYIRSDVTYFCEGSCGEYFADITVSDAKTGEEYYSNAEN